MDGRAYLWCSLGELAPEGFSIAQDHAQQTGIIMLRGTINLAGIRQVKPGEVVQLAYSDGQNWIARLPLRLRVLSSSCNAFAERKVTSVSVGCDFRYFEDRKQSEEDLKSISARNALASQNVEVPEAVWRSAAPSITGSFVAKFILDKLGLVVNGSIPLTNAKILKELDMTAGYTAELGKWCASESYICFLDETGQVNFKKKYATVTTGPLLRKEDMSDFNPINSGDLPAEAVYAKYQSTILNYPKNSSVEDEKKRNWERDQSSSYGEYKHTWTEHLKVPTGQQEQSRDGFGYLLYYNDEPLMKDVYEVQAFDREEIIPYIKNTITLTKYDQKDRVTERTTTTTDQWGESTSKVTFEYKVENYSGPVQPDDYGEVVKETTIETSPVGPIKLSLGAQGSFYSVASGATYLSSKREVTYDKDKNTGITRTVTKTWVPFINTQDGSEIISRLRERKEPWDPVEDLVAVATELVPEPAVTQIRTERQFGIQRRPSEVDRTTEANRKSPDVTDYSKTVWSIGSSASQTSIELSPPYASDDRITYQLPGTWNVIPSDAPQKTLLYAQTENKLLLGNRNGNGIQTIPEFLPHEPLSIFYIRLNGCTAAFLTNGTTWNGTPDGLTVTTDACFWGAVDGTVSNAWFPLPPNAASLPAIVSVAVNSNAKPANAIAIPQGFSFGAPNLATLFNSLPSKQDAIFPYTISPSALIEPYHETIPLTIGARAGAVFELYDWADVATTLMAGAGSGASAVIDSILFLMAGAGSGATIAEDSTLLILAGAGSGATIVEDSSPPSPPSNLSVTWTQAADQGDDLPSLGKQTPTYSATPTTATMRLQYNTWEESAIYASAFFAEIGADTIASLGVVATINGVDISDIFEMFVVSDLPYTGPGTIEFGVINFGGIGTAGVLVLEITAYKGQA